MMKKVKCILIAVALFVSQNKVLAQTFFSDTALYKITYKFIYAYDTADLEKKSVDKMNLYISQYYSVYRNTDYELFVKERMRVRGQIMEQLKTSDKSKPITPNGNVKRVPQTEIFKKLIDNKLYKKEVLIGQDYVIEDNIPQIQWEIEPETKMFGDIKGQKAEGYFRGRKYTAWFAPQLPIRAGPWKLSGLPGVILEAYDDKKEVVFLFTGFELLQKQSSVLIAMPSKYIKVKDHEFQKLQKLALEDPVAFVTNRHAQKGITVSLDGKSLETVYNSRPRPKSAKSPINNAIERVKE